MTDAKIKDGGFRCAPEGHTVKSFGAGKIVSGKVAAWALAAGAAEPYDPRQEVKVDAPEEVKEAAPKPKRGRGRPRKAT